MVLDQNHSDSTAKKLHHKLFRILNAEKEDASKDGDINTNLTFINGVSIRTNPSLQAITIEITCAQSRHLIVRLLNPEGKIEKMFAWYVIKGANITTITETTGLPEGDYRLDILDNDGFVVYNTILNKKS